MKATRLYPLLALLMIGRMTAQAQSDIEALMTARGEYYFSVEIQQPEGGSSANTPMFH